MRCEEISKTSSYIRHWFKKFKLMHRNLLGCLEVGEENIGKLVT